ncbi:MAG: MATE family efflux transporter [Armatimonadetes bacterium]|nr:MATE family efflux transporter [Armatimonadota bacterium]
MSFGSNGRDLTRGPVVGTLVSLAVPVFFANLLQTAYQLVDTFWVGRIGPTAVAAVSLSFPVLFLLISLGGGLAIAGTILVAQYQGQGDRRQVDLVAGQTFLAMFASSALMTGAGYFLGGRLIRLMVRNGDAALVSLATVYLQWTFLGVLFLFTFFVFQSLMRGVGDVVTPLYIVGATVVLNLILDPLFIFHLKMGVAGAAVATVCTQGLAAGVALYLLFSGRHGIRLSLGALRPRWPLLKKIFLLGAPASLEQSSRALGITMMAFLVAQYPTDVVAAYGVGGRVLSFVVIAALGLSMATSAMVGQNLGAGSKTRAAEAVQIAARGGLVVLTLFGVAVLLGGEAIAAIFVPSGPAVIEESALFLRIMAPTFGLIAVQQVLHGAFRGSGNTLTSMVLSLVSLWVLQFPLAFVLSGRAGLGPVGIWLSYPIANLGAVLLAVLWFRRGTWNERRITDELRLEENVQVETMREIGVG